MTDTRLTRTYLAVPAHRARMVERAAESAADAVFLDLEDAVPVGEKNQALLTAIEAIERLDWGSKTVTVRINAVGSPFIQDEVQRLASLSRLDALLLPKAERIDDVSALGETLSANRGNRSEALEFELLIETALGVVNVDALAAAHPSVSALHFGVGDFSASIGARSDEIGLSPRAYRHVGAAADGHAETPLDLFAYPMMRILIAARAFNLRAIDGPFGAFRDLHGTSGSARKAATMGYDGKQVIHPDQIEPTRLAFRPSDHDVASARRVIEAMEAAERDGHGAVTLDGRMIDLANVRMAARVLQFAS
ncbi:HpcH/HpaI aldolase/citrate lyase family protein [Tardiphaga sp.]|jgi:malyl-CoA/(S)-citramalyl-CoA lyase|uniref:HpcH/HpaI aldolase/citrate lyase family protein n=1 Tax=Tardiphaga sp. TaxID=1926292 RepID=UPI0037D9E082